MKQNNTPPLSEFLPQQNPHRYASPGECIYCGSREKLSEEHIIPYALGGKLVLEDSSCATCARETSKFELTCMRTMYGPLRLLYDMPTRRPKKRPKKLPLKVKYTPDQKEWDIALVEQERYPFIVTFPQFEAPGIIAGKKIHESGGPATRKLWIRGACPYSSFDQLLPEILKDLNACEAFPESKADVPAFCRLLCKIAHSYAYAELGNNLDWYLPSMIKDGALDNCMHFIGSVNNSEPAGDDLHNLDIVQFGNSKAVLVRVRLLSKLGTPSYFVAVGEYKQANKCVN